LVHPDTIIGVLRSHPEWRVLPKRPKEYTKSLDLLVPVVLRWCRNTRQRRRVQVVAEDNGTVWVSIDNPGDVRNCNAGVLGSGELAAHLLARVFVESMDRFNENEGKSDDDA
jgi:hypothetical protein